MTPLRDRRSRVLHLRLALRRRLRVLQGGRGPTTQAQRRRAFLILFVSLLCLGAGQSVMFAILPPVSRTLGLSEFQVGLIFAVSATIWVFSSPYWGRRSDVLGRKPVMLIGLFAFAISTALFASVIAAGLFGFLAAAVAYPLMIAARAVYGIFGAGTFAASQAYVADRTTRAERTEGVAMIGAAFGLGTTIGPGIGAALVVLGLLAPFYFIAGAALVSALAILIFLPERTPPRRRVQPPRLSWRDPRVLPFLIFGTLLNTAGAVPIQTVAFFFMDVLKLSIEDAVQMSGVGLMASSMAGLFAQLVLVQRFHLSTRTLIFWGVGLSVAANVLFVFGFTYGVLVAAMVLIGLGFGMARPGFTSASSLAVSPQEQGGVAGLVGATGGAGFIFGPLIGNALYEFDPRAPFVFCAVLLAGLMIYAGLERRIRDVQPEPAEETETNVPKS